MAAWLQLEACKAELNAAMEILSNHCQNPEGVIESEAENTPQPLILPGAPVEVRRARRTIKTGITKLQILLDEPADCVQELSRQVSIFFSDMTESCRNLSLSPSFSAEPTTCLHNLAR